MASMSGTDSAGIMEANDILLNLSALALRRFHPDELAAHARLEPGVVQGWLDVYPDLFQDMKQAKDSGIPPYVVTQEEVQRLTGLLHRLDPRVVQKAFRGDQHDVPIALDALRHLEGWQELLDDARPGEDVGNVTEWRDLWLAATRRQADSLTRAGSPVLEADMARLRELEARSLPAGDGDQPGHVVPVGSQAGPPRRS